MKSKSLLVLILGTLIIFMYLPVATHAQSVNITLTFTNLANPSPDHYEGWIIVNGTPISTGKFTVDSAGKLMTLDGKSISQFTVSGVDPAQISKFVLTLEPKGDTNNQPSSIKLLAGTFDTKTNKATITQNTGKSFDTVKGDYILATPTDGANTNENSGIWYLSLASGSPAVGLVLPDLSNTDWLYEGWVVMNGTPVTTGKFDKPTGVDQFDGYSSTQGGPPFPGEDFLKNAPSGLTFPTNIAGAKTVISIEPRVDNSPAPFQFKPLAGDIPQNAVDHKTYSMTSNVNMFPSGSLKLSVVSSTSSSGLPLNLLSVGISLTFLAVMSVYISKRKFSS